MVKTPEKKEEERKQKTPLMNLPVLEEEEEEEETEANEMKSEIPKRTTFFDQIPMKSRTPRIKIPKSSTKLAKSRKNHSAGKKNILDDNNDEEEEEEEELKTQIAEKILPLKKRWRIQYALAKKNEEEEEELKKMGSKRRNLDDESRTPLTQIAKKSRIGYSIDGKKLQKPGFGYSIDGKKLSRLPPIEEIRGIIGSCSHPFEKKLLKTDVEKISFNKSDVKNGILSYLNEDEKGKLCKEGILVNTYDEFGICYEMKFESYNNCFYKLCDGWKRLYKYHQLKENEDCYVAVWMFRHEKTDGICFAVILKR